MGATAAVAEPASAGTLDFDARYAVSWCRGVAFHLVGYAEETRVTVELVCDHDDVDHDDSCYVEGCEVVTRDDMVRAVMVGDDREHLVDVDDLTVLADGDYCGGCGQVGCTADGR